MRDTTSRTRLFLKNEQFSIGNRTTLDRHYNSVSSVY